MLDVISRCGSNNRYYNVTCWTLSYAAAHTTAIHMLDVISRCGSELLLLWHMLYVISWGCLYDCYYNSICWTLSHAAAHTTAIIITHAGRYLTVRLIINAMMMTHTGHYVKLRPTQVYYNGTCWTLSHAVAHATAIIMTHAGRYLTLRVTQLL